MLIEKEACLLCIIVCILSICGCLYIIKNILKMEDRGFGGELLGLVSTSYLIYSLLNGLECVFYFENIQINQTNCIILGYLKTFSILAGIMWSSIIACGFQTIRYVTLHNQRQFQHSRFALLVFGLLGPFMLASYLLFMQAYGQNYPFSCFIKNENKLQIAVKFFGFYLFLFFSTFFNIIAIIYVFREYSRTRMSKRPIIILLIYPLAILFCWLLMLVQDLYFYLTREYLREFLIASVAFTNLNGFLNFLLFYFSRTYCIVEPSSRCQSLDERLTFNTNRLSNRQQSSKQSKESNVNFSYESIYGERNQDKGSILFN